MFVKQYTSEGIYTFRYLPSNPALAKQKGEVFCFASVSVPAGKLPDKIAKFVWEGMLEKYLFDASGIVVALKNGMRDGESRLRTIIKSDEQLRSTGVDLDMTILVVSDSNLYIAYFGSQNTLLWRDEKYVNITEILKTHGVDAGSFLLQENDVLAVLSGVDVEEISSTSFSPDDIEAKAAKFDARKGVLLLSQQDFTSAPQEEILVEEESIPANVEEPEQEIEPVKDESVEAEEETETVSAYQSRINTIIDNAEELQKAKNIKDIQEEEVTDAAEEMDQEETPVEQVYEKNVMPQEEIREPFVSVAKDKKEDGFGVVKQKAVGTAKNLLTKVKTVKIDKQKLAQGTKSAGRIVMLISDRIGTVFSKIFGFISEKARGFLDNKYGRKIWYKRMMSKVTQVRVVPGASNIKGTRVDGYRTVSERRRRIGLIFLLCIAIVVVVLGVRWSMKVKHESDVHNQVTQILKDAENFLNEADKNSKINTTAAEVNLVSADGKLKEAAIAISKSDKDKIAELEVKKTTIEDQIYRRVGLSESTGNIDLFIDSKIFFKSDKTNPGDLVLKKDSFSNEFLYITDKGDSAVYRVALYDKSVTKLPDANKVLSAPLYIDYGTVGIVVYDANVGMVRSPFNDRGENEDFVKIPGLSSDALANKDISDMGVFGSNNNIFLLSRAQKAVLRSARIDGGTYGLPGPYIEDDLFSQLNEISGDNDYLYVLFAGSSGMKRYSSGEEVSLSFSEIVPEIQNLKCATTVDPNTGKLYVFDKNDSRILVLEKPIDTDNVHPGQYVLLKQLVYRGDRTDVFTDVKDMVVDSSERYLYVLDGVKVWKITL